MKAPPLPRFARQPQRKMFLAFRICARPIFFENGKDIFLFGVLPSILRAVWRGFNADSVLRKLFSGGKDFAKPRLISRAEEGSGEESARASLSDFGGFATIPKHQENCYNRFI